MQSYEILFGMKEFLVSDVLEIYNGRDYSHLQTGKFPLYGSGGLMSYVNSYLYNGEAILLPRKGTLNNIMYVNEKFWTVDTMYYATVNPSFSTYYIFAYLSQLNLKHLDSGSTLPSMTKTAYNNIKIVLPNLTTQKSIAHILSTLDQKIAINNQINAQLEQMAKTLYDYWFVQFDFPDENGKPYKSSGGEMVYNETLKREIPKGWEVKGLGEVEPNIITGKTPSTQNEEFFNGNIPFIKISDIRNNMFIFQTEQKLSKTGAESQSSKYLPKDSLCVSCIATVGLIGFTTQKSQTNQQINSIIFKNKYNGPYFYFYLKDYFFVGKAKTGNTFANMNKGDFANIKMIYPSSNVIEKFFQNIVYSFQKIKKLQKQNQQLAQLRDFLLPMLMNGQVGVGDD